MAQTEEDEVRDNRAIQGEPCPSQLGVYLKPCASIWKAYVPVSPNASGSTLSSYYWGGGIQGAKNAKRITALGGGTQQSVRALAVHE